MKDPQLIYNDNDYNNKYISDSGPYKVEPIHPVQLNPESIGTQDEQIEQMEQIERKARRFLQDRKADYSDYSDCPDVPSMVTSSMPTNVWSDAPSFVPTPAHSTIPTIPTTQGAPLTDAPTNQQLHLHRLDNTRSRWGGGGIGGRFLQEE